MNKTMQKKIESGMGSGLTDLGIMIPGKGLLKDDDKGNVFNIPATDPRFDLVPHLKGKRVTEEQMEEALRNVVIPEKIETAKKKK
jgi:hypothetical protein